MCFACRLWTKTEKKVFNEALLSWLLRSRATFSFSALCTVAIKLNSCEDETLVGRSDLSK